MRRSILLSAVLLLACSSEAPPVEYGLGGGGAGGTGGTAAGTGGSGGSAGAVAGSSGAPASGGAGGGGSGGMTTAGSGGAGSGGSAGAGGAGGSGGSGVSGSGGGGAGGNGGSGGGGSTLPKRVLLYHFSTLAIASLQQQLTLLEDKLEGWGYEVEKSESPTVMTATNLARFGAVAMVNTCFEPFGKGASGQTEAGALKTFVEAGGGLFGTHCASVTYQQAQPPHPYNALIGGRGGDGYFEGTSACTTSTQHPTTAELPATFSYMGNLDNADYVAPDTTVLVKCKWSGGEQKEHAVSWYRTPGSGRVFFSNFAKEVGDLSNATIGDKHLLAGLSWVLRR